MEDFKLIHENGRLIAVVVINGKTYKKDVTDYFNEANAHDDWLDYNLGFEI